MSEFAVPTSLVEQGGMKTVMAYREGHSDPIYQADERHPHFKGILDGLRSGDEGVWELFDVADGIMSRFRQVTDRISWDGETVFFDGDPIHTVLASQLSRALSDGNVDNYTALAKFWEKLAANPNEHSRTQAYDWLAAHKFQITEEGDIVGYKYVNKDGEGFLSSASSSVSGVPSGYVNGVPVPPLSQIPQSIGDVITMPRSEVEHDPRHACSRGLHVGTYDYVNGYGEVILMVHVNPRDVVSVPTDGNGGKVRACRYVVAGVAEKGGLRSDAPVLRQESTMTWTPDVSYRMD